MTALNTARGTQKGRFTLSVSTKHDQPVALAEHFVTMLNGLPHVNAITAVDAACWVAVADTVRKTFNAQMPKDAKKVTLFGPGLTHLTREQGKELTPLLVALNYTSLPREARDMAQKWAALLPLERQYFYGKTAGAATPRDEQRAWRRAMFFAFGGVEV